MTPCGWPVRWLQAPTRPLSSLRSAASCWRVTGGVAEGPSRADGTDGARVADEADGADGVRVTDEVTGAAGAALAVRERAASWDCWRLLSRVRTWSGSSRPGRPRKSSSSGEPGRGRGAELAAVEQDPVEVDGRVEGLEGGLVEQVGRIPLALGLGEFAHLGLLAGAGGKHVVPFGLEFGGEPEQDRHRGQEHRGGLAPPAGPDEPAHGLGEVQGGGHAGGVHADGQSRDVHALGDHPDGDHPALVRGGERGDLLGRRRVVGQHHDGAAPGQAAQQRGIGPRVGVITRDDQAGGVGHGPADLGQPLVGGFQYPADPLPRRVERGPPGLRDLVPGHRRAQGGGDLVPGPGAPAHLAGVGQEDHRAHHTVLERGPVAVHVVRGAALAAARFVGVGDERDGAGVAAERRAGQREPAPGRIEGLLDRVPQDSASPA